MADVAVRGRYLKGDDTPASGQVTFAPRPRSINDSGDGDILVSSAVTAVLDDAGEFEVTLQASDDPSLAPTGWTYLVVERIVGAREVRAYDIDVPTAAAGPGIDLWTVAPASASAGEPTAFVTLTAFVGLVADLELEETAREAGDAALAVAVGAEVAARIAGDALAVPLASVGAANGVAPLDAGLKVPAANLPATLVRVADLVYPVSIAHRDAGNLAPENTMTAFDNCIAQGMQAIEAGDVHGIADGGLVIMHDATVDRTTTSTGNVATLNTAGARLLNADAPVWFGGNQPDTKVPFFDDVLTRIGGAAVNFVEVKDTLDATATKICDRVDRLGLRESFVIASSTLSNVQVATARGYAGMLVVSTIAACPAPATLAAAGVGFVAMSYTATGDLAGWVASLHALGIKAIAYSVDHQKDWDAMIAAGFDGVFSNDPMYASRNYAKYRRTSTTWAQNGTFSHGMAPAGTGPYTPTTRGSFVGAVGAYRWLPSSNTHVVAGEINPVPNPTGTYTVTARIGVESVPGNTTTGACVFVAAPDDSATQLSNNVPRSYLLKMRASGTLSAWRIDASGGAGATFTPITTTAFSRPTLSSGLAAGVAITALPVNALTVALKSGHQFYLPTTQQVVTLTANAAIGATSLAVSSVTPSAAVSSGASLTPRITLTIAITPTSVTFARADERPRGASLPPTQLSAGRMS